MGAREEKYYLVRDDILPEAVLKTIEAKQLLEAGVVETVNEAVSKVGLSRSAYYKYKDGIFPFNAMMKQMIITISLQLEHRSGVLSRVLAFVAGKGGNILTINQTIPLQGVANLTLSIDTAGLTLTTTNFIDELQQLDGVRRAVMIGRG
ncbi:ACT domain-containing protein [Ammoniphilus resinae]|uniref:UPF0735 ACT domain-containing protein J2Z37_000408 n=1 Tax=Ammoniphilus resinae TaxID=861532 RepID=A0ABS4GJJ7_9BACL|nr:ACT domain-containing protein [Ammoniphilus resinae]MBP1930421.1 chorismate mutase [Ammoniphilus resinae]